MTTIENGSVLVAVSEYGEFNAMLRLCRMIETRLKLHPVFVFSPTYGLVKEHSQLAEAEGWSWVQLGCLEYSYLSTLDISSKNGYFRVYDDRIFFGKTRIWSNPSLLRKKFNIARLYASYAYRRGRRLYRIVLRLLLRGIVKVNVDESGVRLPRNPLKRLQMQLQHAEEIFQSVYPRLILSGQDYALSVTAILAKVGENSGIKTAIIPYSMPPTTREVIETFSYFNFNRLQGIEKKVASNLNPKWINFHRGHAYCRLNVFDALAAEKLDLMPPEPWLPNSGKGIIFATSQQCYDYYSSAGVAKKQLKLTGSDWNDHLVQAASSREKRKSQLFDRIQARYKKAKINTSHMLIIISWPPNQWPRKAKECRSYEELCQQFITYLSHIQNSGLATAVISLHPTLRDHKLVENLESAELYVLRSNLMEFIDCTDIFISTVSSTSFWALQCGIPTINFDGYLYGYTEFDEAGAITVKTPLEAYEVIERILSEDAFFLETKRQIAQKSGYFTITDGKCMERILDALAALASPPVNIDSTNLLIE